MAARAKAAAKRTAATTTAKKDPTAIPDAPPTISAPVTPALKGTGAGGKGVFTELRSNVKGHYADLLQGCTAWTSTRNERGKTARLDSIRLALTGAHSAAKRGAGLLALSADVDRLFVELRGNAGTARYEIPKGRVTGDHSIVLHGHDVAAPMMPDLGLTTLTDSQLRQMLFTRFPVDVSLAVPDATSEVQQAFWQEAIVKAADDLELDIQKLTNNAVARALVLGQIPGMLAAIKRDQKKAIDRASEQQIARRSELVALGPCPTPETVAAYGERYRVAAQADEVCQVVTDLNARAQEHADLTAKLKTVTEPLKVDFAALDASVDAAQKATEDARKDRTAAETTIGLYGKVADLRELHVRTAEQQGGHAACLTCGGQVELEALRISLHQIRQHVQPYENYLQQLDAAIDEKHKAALKLQREVNAKKQAYTEQVAQHSRAANDLNARLAIATEGYRMLTLQWQRIGAAANLDMTNNEAVAAFIQASAAARGTDLAATKREAEATHQLAVAYEQLKVDEGKTQVARTHLQALTALEAVAKQTVENETKKLVTPVEKAVNSFMPTGTKARLMLLDVDGTPCCRFEVAGHDGTWRAYGAAPGRSWMALTLAVASAFLPGEESDLRVVLLDDADLAPFAPEARTELLKAFSAMQAAGKLDHVFVACTQPETIPEGYLHYRLD